MQSTSTKMKSIIGQEYLRELETEVKATRECLANTPMDDPEWKPHEKSMPLGYLAAMVAEMPKWITYIIEKNEVNFGTFEHEKVKTTEDLVAAFDKNMENVRKSFEMLTDDGLKKTFTLRNEDQVLMTLPVDEVISQSINHLVHHRGQLTVYLKLLDKPIPSIYGPSADSGGF
jgi:uncharacterized damage-inducible protein DinB